MYAIWAQSYMEPYFSNTTGVDSDVVSTGFLRVRQAEL